MNKITRTLLGAAATTALFAGSAFADEKTQPSQPHIVYVDQVNLNNSIADLDVHVKKVAKTVSAVSVANGNHASGQASNGIVDFDAIQRNDGFIRATSKVTGPHVRGPVDVSTTAYGNSADSGAWNGSALHFADQDQNSDVLTRTNVYLDSAKKVTATTTAGGNISTTAAENGQIDSFQTQSVEWNVTALSDVDVGHLKNGRFISNASGNTATSNGYETNSDNGSVQTTAAHITVYSDSYVSAYSAKNVDSASVASGNIHQVNNEWGHASLGTEGSEVFQGNDGRVTTQSHVTLKHWSGRGSSSASGVGNNASLYNTGGGTQLNAIQNNFGAVKSTASFSAHQGSPGGAGSAIATSIGNNAVASCHSCADQTLSGHLKQTNGANILAQSSVSVGKAGHVSGSATAIGNTATFSSTGD